MEAAVLRCLGWTPSALGATRAMTPSALGAILTGGSSFGRLAVAADARARRRATRSPVLVHRTRDNVDAERGLGKEWRFESEDRTHRSVIGVRVLKEFLVFCLCLRPLP